MHTIFWAINYLFIVILASNGICKDTFFIVFFSSAIVLDFFCGFSFYTKMLVRYRYMKLLKLGKNR